MNEHQDEVNKTIHSSRNASHARLEKLLNSSLNANCSDPIYFHVHSFHLVLILMVLGSANVRSSFEFIFICYSSRLKLLGIR